MAFLDELTARWAVSLSRSAATSNRLGASIKAKWTAAAEEGYYGVEKTVDDRNTLKEATSSTIDIGCRNSGDYGDERSSSEEDGSK